MRTSQVIVRRRNSVAGEAKHEIGAIFVRSKIYFGVDAAGNPATIREA
jgi:hypothetical protein